MLFPNHAEPSGIAAIGSMTAAIKAQRALARIGLEAEVISLSPEETKRGCAYGISFPLFQSSAVRNALRTAKIPVSEYLQKGGNDS